MKRYALLVAYDGTAYGGWQIQKNNVTVQQKMQEAAEEIFGAPTTVTASGRTDSGVHASGQVCHFDAETSIPPERIAEAFNALLPQDISVLASAQAPAGFDSNRSAKRKTYCYKMYFSSRRNPLLDRYSLWVRGRADLQKLQYICRFFEGEHDFKAYSKSGSTAKTTVRTIYSVEVASREVPPGDGGNSGIFSADGRIEVNIFVTGNGFLYNMVRTIAGTVLGYSQGFITEEQIALSLKTGDRSLVGKTLPPNGLELVSVRYD